MIFEIYLTDKNDPQTNIEIPADWSFKPKEKEVILLPFFAFQVVYISTVNEDFSKLTKITLVEIPFQNCL